MRRKNVVWGVTAVLLGTFFLYFIVTHREKEQETRAPGQEISGEITVWEHAITFESAMEKLIEGFEEKYPKVKVEWEIRDMENYYDLVSMALQSGDGPDLFYTDGIARTKMREYAEKGMILDLTDRVKLWNFDESALWRETIDGKCYGVPWMTFDSRIVYYNADLFAEHDWKIPATFEEFEQLLASIKEAGVVPISLTPHDSYSLLFLWEPILTAMEPEYASKLGKESVDMMGEPVRTALQKMLDWAEAGYFGDNWMDVLNGNSQGMNFTKGETAMNVCGSWDGITMQSNNPDLNIGIFILPSKDGVPGLMGGIASGFSVNAASDNPEAALAFADYCASLEGQTRWIQAHGGISANRHIEASTENSKLIAEKADGRLYTSWQLVLASLSQEAVTVWEKGFVKLFSGEITIDQLLGDIAATLK